MNSDEVRRLEAEVLDAPISDAVAAGERAAIEQWRRERTAAPPTQVTEPSPPARTPLGGGYRCRPYNKAASLFVLELVKYTGMLVIVGMVLFGLGFLGVFAQVVGEGVQTIVLTVTTFHDGIRAAGGH